MVVVAQVRAVRPFPVSLSVSLRQVGKTVFLYLRKGSGGREENGKVTLRSYVRVLVV